MQNTLVLVDGSSYFYRAFHAMPPLTNSKGQPLGAVYGVVNMVKRLIKDYPTDHFVLVFDAKGKTFRDELFADYKANRPPMPDELRQQFQPMIDILDAMGLPIVMIEGVEADDVIGTLAVAASEKGMQVVISTGDKDIAQLVNDNITLINTMSNTQLDVAGVKEKFGVPPELIIDYLALIGDTSDNIPGVPKVGPKTAVKWLDLYQSFDGVLENADNIKGKVGENLRASLEFLPLSRELVTIKLDVSLPFTFDVLTKVAADKTRLIELYTDYEFKSWLSLLQKPEDKKVAVVEKNYQTIVSQDALTDWLERIKAQGVFAFDTETTSLDVMQAEIVGVSFAVKPDEAAYVPVAHDEETTQLSRSEVLAALKPLLENPELLIIGQNLKYDINVLKKYGIHCQGIAYDTMLESYVLNASSNRHDMDSLASNYLGLETMKFEDVAGKGKKQLTFNQIAIDKASAYAAEDADITLKLHKYLMPRVKAMPKLKRLFNHIEMPLVPILADIEHRGVLIDKELLAAQSARLKVRIAQLAKEVYSIAGEEFNLSSPKQLQVILFEKLALPVIKKTPKGQPSTAEAVLQELALDFPLPKLIVEHRSLTKLVSTYLDALPQRINQTTGRVHTSYNQAITATGRLSSSEPNLQNIPVRSDEGRDIRRAFIARPGYQLLAADYSQVELRIMAHLSGDEGLLSAFKQGIDIHAATASEVFNVPLAEVTTELRRRSKAINFGLIYGMSSFGLAKQLGIGRQEAKDYIDLYFARYPGVLRYMEETRALAHDLGYVETLFGRRLYLPDIKAKNKMLVNAAERTAINAPMQGTAADIIKKAMIDVYAWQQTAELDCHMIMQVHDELVFEILDEHLDAAKEKIKALMENTAELAVPLIVDIGSGPNWELAH